MGFVYLISGKFYFSFLVKILPVFKKKKKKKKKKPCLLFDNNHYPLVASISSHLYLGKSSFAIFWYVIVCGIYIT